MMGARSGAQQLFYPKHEVAARHGAETPEETPDPPVAYAGLRRPEPCEAGDWPLA